MVTSNHENNILDVITYVHVYTCNAMIQITNPKNILPQESNGISPCMTVWHDTESHALVPDGHPLILDTSW